jgi:hypothetical protein
MMMKGIAALLGALALVGCMNVSTASADEPKDFKNLKILDGTDKKAFDKGMKTFSKGLGVKCNACHVKGEFDNDQIATKGEARRFFNMSVGEKDTAKRESALAELLKALKVEKAKDPKSVWAAVDGFKKK